MRKKGFWYWFWWAVLILAAAIILAYFIIPGARYAFIRFWKPKEESARRQAFQETKSYVFAARQDIAEYYRQWHTANDAEKKAIENAIRLRFSTFPAKEIPDPVIRKWFTEVIRGIPPQ